MKRVTEKLTSLTNFNLKYDGIEHVENLKMHANSVEEYVNRVKDSDVFIKSKSFKRHLNDNPNDIRIVSFSDMKNYFVCYCLLYKSSLSPFFIHGNKH